MKKSIRSIAICGSMSFAKEMIEAKRNLERLGLEVIIQDDVEEHAAGRIADEDKWRKLEIDPLKSYFKKIKGSDAILVMNMDKKGIKHYVGGNTLIEMAFAYVLDKRIFLFNPIPEMSYSDEIAATKPVVLNHDYEQILRVR